MTMEKYGVEDRRELLELELEAIRKRLLSPDLSKIASHDQVDYLMQREKDVVEMLDALEKEQN